MVVNKMLTRSSDVSEIKLCFEPMVLSKLGGSVMVQAVHTM
jgi:hypothetical protein